MEAATLRHIKPGNQYERFFPPANGGVYTVKENATLEDTVAFIPKVVYSTVGQTKTIAIQLKGKTVYDTCSNIWHFVYDHIQYKKDKKGFEQIRSPARAWSDRRTGVDCDCYSVLISTILINLSIPHVLRITKYRQDHFQHIYPVVPAAGGEIILDCVTNDFDYEVPYSEKKDFKMDLQFLNGFDDPTPSVGDTDLLPVGFAGDGVGELGKLRINFKKVLHAINRFNPATILLRNGVLASMKLNLFGVAGKLRWSYLSPAEAVKKGINPQKFGRLVGVRKKLESIFNGTGGKVNNLKKAILKGKGNKDHAVVAGLGDLDVGDIDYMDTGTPLRQLLGPDMYNSENERTFLGFAGFDGLGEPATAASVTAASGIIAAIAAALKKVGDLFSNKGQQGNSHSNSNSTEDNSSNAGSSGDSGSSAGSSYSPANTPATSSGNSIPRNTAASNSWSPVKTGSSTPASANTVTTPDMETPASGPVTANVIPAGPPNASGGGAASNGDVTAPTTQSFWDKNKSWLKPVAIGAGGIAVLTIGYHLLKPKPHPASPPLTGAPKGKKQNHPRKNNGKQHRKQKAVSLL